MSLYSLLYCCELLPPKLANNCVKEASLMFYTREANQIIKKLQNREGVTLHFLFIPLISFLAQNSDTFQASKVH